MAKKLVKYAFGTPESYAALIKKDEYTVYFIFDTVEEEGKQVPGPYGTIYRGATRIGSGMAKDIIFTEDIPVHFPESATDDDSLIYTIEAGSSLTKVAADILRTAKEWDENVRSEIITTINAEIQGPEGEIFKAINTTVCAYLFTYDEVTGEMKDNYVTIDKLGKVQELADKWDDTTLETIIRAAEGIQAVVKDYYKKSEIGDWKEDEWDETTLLEYLDRVKVYDTSSGFPEVGDPKCLYVSDDDNIMYRWGRPDEETQDREYIEISGSGGGGYDVTVVTALYLKDNKADMTIARGASCTFKYAFSSANTFTKYTKKHGFEKVEQQIGTIGSVKYFVDNVQVGSGNAIQHNYYEDDSKNVYNTYTIPASKFGTSSTHTIRIEAEDKEGHKATKEININIISLEITSSYVPTPTSLTSNITVPVTVTATTDVDLYYKIDSYTPVHCGSARVSGMYNTNITITPYGDGGARLAHGYHAIQVWAETVIEETEEEISTAPLAYSVIWYDVNGAPIVSSYMNTEPNPEGKYETEQYGYITLNYQLYPRGTVQLVIQNSEGAETIVSTLSIDTTLKTWTYTFDEEGEFTMFVRAISGTTPVESTKYHILVNRSSIEAGAAPGSVMFLTAKNRSNDEDPETRQKWQSILVGEETISAQLTGFNWNDISGWYKDPNSDTRSLKVGGGARVTIPFKPFDSDYTENGQTFEIEFKTSNLSNSETEVISCYSDDDNSGFRIFANGAKFYATDFAGDNAISVPFKDGEKLRLSIVITPYKQDDEGHGTREVKLYDVQTQQYTTIDSVASGWWRFVKIYLNGKLSMVKNYTNKFMQSKPSSIVIGSDQATVDIYSVRAYRKALYNKAIVDNFIADTQDPAIKLYLYKRNLILNNAGTDVDAEALKHKMPCMYITCQPDAKNAEEHFTNPGHTLPKFKGDKLGVNLVFDSTAINDENALKYYNFCTPFVAYNAQIDVQGTSSQYYPRKNWKIKFKGDSYNPDYEAQMETKKPTYLYTNTISAVRGQAANYSDKGKYKLKDYSHAEPGVEGSAIDKITSLPGKVYTLKADFMESSGVHNTGTANYVDYILKTLGPNYLTPPQYAQYLAGGGKMTKVDIRTTVEGYPIALFWRPTEADEYEFYGKFNFNTDKAAENIFGFIDKPAEELVNPYTNLPFALFNEDFYEDSRLTPADRYAYEPPVECWEFGDNTSDVSKFKNVTDLTFEQLDQEGKRMWYTAFETRHPDNDQLISDYENGKIPTEWKKFLIWMSSTDRQGYFDPNTKTLPIAEAWNGTLEELKEGHSGGGVTYETYPGSEAAFRVAAAEEGSTIDPDICYILNPKKQDGSEDFDHPDYNHVMVYVNDAWINNGKYEDIESASLSARYYINEVTDVENYHYVYVYDKTEEDWVRVAYLESYRLPADVTYPDSSVVYRYDTAEYRLAKFKNELPKHMNINMTVAYYILTEFNAMADQRAKNMMFASWGYESNDVKYPSDPGFDTPEAAAQRGYKPVYEYSIGTNLSAPNPTQTTSDDNIILGADGDANADPTTPTPGDVVFNEVYPNGKQVELYNKTSNNITLVGCYLKGWDETGAARDTWTITSGFADALMPPKGYAIYTHKKAKEGGDGIQGPLYGLSASAEWKFELYNANNELLDTVTNNMTCTNALPQSFGEGKGNGVPTGAGALARTYDGASTWTLFSESTIDAKNGTICINEVDPTATSSGDKRIEIYNGCSVPVSLEGWTLKKTKKIAEYGTSKEASVTFDSSVEIPSKGFYVVRCNKDSSEPNVLSAGISGTDGFALRLFDSNLDLADSIVYDAVDTDDFVPIPSGKTYGRASDGANTWQTFETGTIGATNAAIPIVVPVTELTSFKAYNTVIEEFSGLCYNEDMSGYIAVSDKGYVYDLTFEGVATKRNITVHGSVAEKQDYEGATRSTADNHIYIINESSGELLKLEGNDLTVVAKFDLVGTVEGQSFEGIAHYTGQKFFIGNQSSPVAIYLTDLADDVPTLTPVAEIDFIDEIADLHYDHGTGSLWIIDSLGTIVAECGVAESLDAIALIQKFHPNLETGDVENAEALVVDFAEDRIILGCDNTTTRRLYKFSISGAPFDKTVVINECDPDKKFFELYNATNAAIDIHGYTISKDGKTTDIFTFDRTKRTTIIPAKGRLVIPVKSDGLVGPTFGMSADKGFVYELKNGTSVVDTVTVLSVSEGATIGCRKDGDKEHFVEFRAHGNIGYANESGVLNAGIYLNEIDPNEKKIELYNSTSDDFDLVGCKLYKDESEYIFSSLSEITSVPAGGYSVVTCDKNGDNIVKPKFGISGTKGFVLTLKASDDVIIDTVNDSSVNNPNFTTIGETESWGRASDGEDHNMVIFPVPTLGAANEDGELYEPTIEESTGIYINEVLPSEDKIELYNGTGAPVNIGGYIISRNGDATDMWAVPANTTINDYLVISCKQWDASVGPKFGLSNDGFLLTLADNTGKIIDLIDNRSTSETYLATSAGQSIGRTIDGASTLIVFSTPSLGADNTTGVPYDPSGDVIDPGEIITSHVVINEICGDTKQIEMYNPTTVPVNMGGNFALIKYDIDGYVNDGTDCDYWIFPAGCVIPAGGRYIVTAGGLDTETPGPTFGISLKSVDKKFKLSLYAVTAATNYATLDTINATATLVDIINNYDGPIAVCESGSYWTLGRVEDAASNLCIFEGNASQPGTIGLTNNGGVKHRITGGGGDARVVKTPLYYVPDACNYIYYPIFYDNDSILSLDNEGHIKFKPNVESTDIVGSGYAFNGTESALWLNLKDAYKNEISNLYSLLRSQQILTYENCDKFYKTELSDMWPENIYNVDAKFKYIDPATKGYTDFQYTDPDTGKYGVTRRDATYLYEAQGSREDHRKWWLTNRFTYMDSRYNCGDYFSNYVTMRIYTPTDYNPVVPPNATFTLTPYCDMYLRIKFAKNDIFVRANKNVPTQVVPPAIKFNDTETIIYGASNILDFGDMAGKYARTAQFGAATKVKSLVFGHEAPYYNKNLTELDLAANGSVLTDLDVRGSSNLATITSINHATALQKFYATNTAMSTVDFPTSGSNLREVKFPASLTQVKFVNMPYIENDNITIPNYNGIAEIWIENCPNVNAWTIVNSAMESGNALSVIRITNVDWSIQSAPAFEKWTKILGMNRYDDGGFIKTGCPYITGRVKIDTLVSTGYKSAIESKFANIGCDLEVVTSNTSDLTGISIEGETNIAVKEEYTYKVKYNPDNYILDEQRGVTWNIPDAFTIVAGGQSGDDYVTLKFDQSTSGTTPYTVSITSNVYPTMTGSIIILPNPTLSAIDLYDEDGNKILAETIVDADEDSRIMFMVGFTPSRTKDTNVRIVLTNADKAFAPTPYEYDSVNKRLYIYTANVSEDVSGTVRVESLDVTGVRSVAANIRVHNVVSRILYLQDANNVKLPGSAQISYTNAFTGVAESETIYTVNGEFIFPANSKYGTEKLTLTNIRPSAAATKFYNNVGTFVYDRIDAESMREDRKETITFYEPVTYTFNIWHDTTPIEDAYIKLYSLQNESEYGFITPPYNNVISTVVNGEGGKTYTRIVMKLLANTKHDLSFVECDAQGAELLVNKTYVNLNTTMSTGVSDITKDIYLTRDYLGDVNRYGATKLHMTVKTGNPRTSLRLHAYITDTVTISWGDGTSTVLDGDRHGTEDYSFNKDILVCHAYGSSNVEHEYDIWVNENTANIKWLHVIRPDANVGKAFVTYTSYMLPCFYEGSDISTLPTTWSGTAAQNGGLVAYQSVGEAQFKAVPTFRFAEKKYSVLACVGNIYNTFTNMTAADELFKNNVLEQISTAQMFRYNTEIITFKETFANTNLTSIPNEFFLYNTKAENFYKTFANCANLTTIHTSAEGVIFHQDEGVELRNLYQTFTGCSKLTDEIPTLWRRYYGCSALRAPHTFDGCTSLSNFTTIPNEWGGMGETYYEANIKILEYLQVGNISESGEGYFDIDDFYPTNNLRYLFDYECIDGHYEGMPVAGAAKVTMEGASEAAAIIAYEEDPYNKEGLYQMSNIDFIKGGSQTGGSAGSFSGALRYRLGNTVATDFEPTKVKIGSRYEANETIFNTGYRDPARADEMRTNRVIVDICKTASAVVKSRKYDNLTQSWTDSSTTYITEWTNDQTFAANLPFRLFGSYDNYHNVNPITGEPDVQGYYIPQQKQRNLLKGKFHSLEVYAPSTADNTMGGAYAETILIHKFVPAYGMIDGNLVPFIYDEVTESRYLYCPHPYSGESPDILTDTSPNSIVSFYKKEN